MKSHCLATGRGQSICGAAVTCPGQSPHTAGVCAVVVAVRCGGGKLARCHDITVEKENSFFPTGSYDSAASTKRLQASYSAFHSYVFLPFYL